MQSLWRKRFLDIFPVPKYISLGSAACALDGDRFHFIEFGGHGRKVSLKSFGSYSLSTPLEKLPQPPAPEVRKAVIAALMRADIRSVSLVIPEQSAYVFLTQVPLAEPKLIREAISFKLEEHVPIALADALFEYEILAVDSVKETASAAVRVVPRVHVESLISIFDGSGIVVAGCDTESKALARAIAPTGDGVYLLIHIGSASTVFVIAKQGVPLFSSTLSTGSSEITEAVAKVFSVPLAEVPKLRSRMRSDTAPDPKLFDALVPTLAAIRDEADAVIDYWNSHADDMPASLVKSILLSGEDVVFPSVMAYLELAFSVPISIADVWRNAGISGQSVPEIELESAIGFAPVIGAALH
jgi:Tfp pilus assembly PilM family ATPase